MPCRSTLTSGRLLWCLSLAMAAAVPLGRLDAQVKAIGVIPDPRMPDSAQQAAMMGVGMRTRSPAAFALSMKQELGLTPEQVAAVEALVPIEADSMQARMRRLLEQSQERARQQPPAALRAAMSWTGPIDEAAIRAAACEQSQAQADLLIGMMRDRHALGILLTPDQQNQLDRLQSELMVKAMQSKIK